MKEIRNILRKQKYKKRYICIAHNVELGRVELDEYVNIAHHAQVSNAKIGARTSIGRYSKIQHAVIGKFCSISWDVTIGAVAHPLNAVSTHAFSYRKKFGLCNEDETLSHDNVQIGNDVWIGCNSVIMPGVCIGDGAVVGAGTVVTHDVMPYEIVAGCPAKHIRYRFSENTVNVLKEIQWWDLPDELIRENISLFSPKINIEEHSGEETLSELKKLSVICKGW